MKKKAAGAPKSVMAEVVSKFALGEQVTSLHQPILLQAAGLVQRMAANEDAPVLELSAQATPSEIRHARRMCAVKRGRDVYLPARQELSTAIPNMLTSSALWSVKTIAAGHDSSLHIGSEITEQIDTSPRERSWHEVFDGTQIAALGDVTILNRGPALGAYDRRVFAACLDHYKDDRPLSPGGSASWVEVSFYRFIRGLDVGYSVDTHRAVRNSLERLSALSLHVRHAGLERSEFLNRLQTCMDQRVGPLFHTRRLMRAKV